VYLGIAFYGYRRPASCCFSSRNRPCVLRCLVSADKLQARIEERKRIKEAKAKAGAMRLGKSSLSEHSTEQPVALPMAKPSRTAKFLAKCRGAGMKEQSLLVLAFAFVNVAVFLIGFFSNLSSGFKGSIAYPFAKGGGFILDLNCAVIVLPTLRSLQTYLQGAGSTRELIPMDDPIALHINIAKFIAIGTLIHVSSHVVHMLQIAGSSPLQRDPLDLWALSSDEVVAGTSIFHQVLDWRSFVTPVTGVLVTVLMFLMAVTALPCTRRGTNCVTRRLGGYNLFWRVHSWWKWVYVLLLLHAPLRIWVWLLFPMIFIALDRSLAVAVEKPFAILKSVQALPRDVMGLTFDVPPGFTYEAGQYILLGWRGEWHPFTLTSAPQENVLSVHIRAPSSLDWCSALRHRLLIDAPTQAARKQLTGEERVRPHTTVEYTQSLCSRGRVIYCQPQPEEVVPALPQLLSAGSCGSRRRTGGQKKEAPLPESVGKHDGPEESELPPRTKTTLSSQQAEPLPDDAVVLRLSGPFGAPAQKVWGFETVMIVGSGIGVTPFASILRSVQLRAKQREAILGAVAKSEDNNKTGLVPPSNKLGGFDWLYSAISGGNPLAAADEGSPASGQRGAASRLRRDPTRDELGIKHLLNNVVKVPRRVYFYWIVRSQDDLDWFADLLKSAVEGPAKENVVISVFLTGEIELSQVKEMSFIHHHNFGRPNWGRIFKKVKDEHDGEHVGVFLCGSPAIGQELSRQSVQHTDPPSLVGGTRFSFFKEHF